MFHFMIQFHLVLLFSGGVLCISDDTASMLIPSSDLFCDGIEFINTTSFTIPSSSSTTFPSGNLNCSWVMDVLVGYYVEIAVNAYLSGDDFLEIRRLTDENHYTLTGQIDGLYWMPAGMVIINLQAVNEGDLLVKISTYPLHQNGEKLVNVSVDSSGSLVDLSGLVDHNLVINAYAAKDPGVSINVVLDNSTDPNNLYLSSYFVFSGNTCYGKFLRNLQSIVDSTSPNFVSGNVTICSGTKRVLGQLLFQEKTSVSSLETYIVKKLQNEIITYNRSYGDMAISYISSNSLLLQIDNVFIEKSPNPLVYDGTIESLPVTTLQNNTIYQDTSLYGSIYSIRLNQDSIGSFEVRSSSFCPVYQQIDLHEDPFHFPVNKLSSGDYSGYNNCTWTMIVDQNHLIRVLLQGSLSSNDKVIISKPDGTSLTFSGALYQPGVVVGQGTTVINLQTYSVLGTFGFFVYLHEYNITASRNISVESGTGQLYDIQGLFTTEYIFMSSQSITSFSLTVVTLDNIDNLLSNCFAVDSDQKFLFTLLDVTASAAICPNFTRVLCVNNSSVQQYGSILVQDTKNIDQLVFSARYASTTASITYESYEVVQAITLILLDNQSLFINDFKEIGSPIEVIDSTPEKKPYANLSMISSMPFESDHKLTTFVCPSQTVAYFTVEVREKSADTLSSLGFVFVFVLSVWNLM